MQPTASAFAACAREKRGPLYEQQRRPDRQNGGTEYVEPKRKRGKAQGEIYGLKDARRQQGRPCGEIDAAAYFSLVRRSLSEGQIGQNRADGKHCARRKAAHRPREHAADDRLLPRPRLGRILRPHAHGTADEGADGTECGKPQYEDRTDPEGDLKGAPLFIRPFSREKLPGHSRLLRPHFSPLFRAARLPSAYFYCTKKTRIRQL